MIMFYVLAGFIGVILGVVVMACCAAARTADFYIALARKDAQINNLCARLRLIEGNGVYTSGDDMLCGHPRSAIESTAH